MLERNCFLKRGRQGYFDEALSVRTLPHIDASYQSNVPAPIGSGIGDSDNGLYNVNAIATGERANVLIQTYVGKQGTDRNSQIFPIHKFAIF